MAPVGSNWDGRLRKFLTSHMQHLRTINQHWPALLSTLSRPIALNKLYQQLSVLFWVQCGVMEAWGPEARVVTSKFSEEEGAYSISIFKYFYLKSRRFFERNGQEEYEAVSTHNSGIVSLPFLSLYWPKDILSTIFLFLICILILH